MIGDQLKYHILQSFGFPPTAEQEHAVNVFCQFMCCRDDRVVMILRGSAGTGKTTLAGAIVRSMAALKQKMVLLAPTGRAAKVFAHHAGHAAYTIHRRIYRQRTAGDLSAFNLNVNLQRDTLYIVDEASMVSNGGREQTAFGSGCLLDDLMQYVYSADQNCRLLLIGDPAQLPPVGEEARPALMAAVLRSYGMQVYETDLSEVLRQAQASGILYNATRIRSEKVTESALLALPRIRLHGFADIRIVPGDELIESLATSYSRAGQDDTIVITRSNKRANVYNQGIRNTVLDRDEELGSVFSSNEDAAALYDSVRYYIKANILMLPEFDPYGTINSLLEDHDVTLDDLCRWADIFRKMPCYEKINVNGRTCVAVHAGYSENTKNIGKLYPDADIKDFYIYAREAGLKFGGIPHGMIIFGHTPTTAQGTLFYNNGNVFKYYDRDKDCVFYNIDCGCVFRSISPEAKLACIRLEDEKVFYI